MPRSNSKVRWFRLMKAASKNARPTRSWVIIESIPAARCVLKAAVSASVRALSLALVAVMIPASMFAQARTSTAAPPSSITRPDSIQDSGMYKYWTEMNNQQRAGGALFGQLTVEGQPLLWDPVLITVDCQGATVHTAQSDPKGNFAIVGVKLAGVLGVQDDSVRQMETHLEGCTVQGSLPGFQSSTIAITARNLRDQPDLGTLTLRPEGTALGSMVSETTQSAPGDAVKHFQVAGAALMEQNPDKARRELKKAVEIDPKFAEAWYQLGKLQQPDHLPESRDSFTKAVAADPKYLPPYEQLAALAVQSGKWQEAVDNTNHAVQLNPSGTMQTWYYNALANLQLGKADAAEASARKSLAMDPLHLIPMTDEMLAVILVKKGNYPEALAHLRNCLTYLPAGDGRETVKRQIKQLEQQVSKK